MYRIRKLSGRKEMTHKGNMVHAHLTLLVGFVIVSKGYYNSGGS